MIFLLQKGVRSRLKSARLKAILESILIERVLKNWRHLMRYEIFYQTLYHGGNGHLYS